ncbi:MAG: DoxX family membrane protein [Desulfobulbaceae bacterium]|nr:DoxX family membrane protein [Candidatus Kapabacteria bacterium]MBS3998982.1 DoxX family membrane protein [Desulfobulbaceae bacterium]
MKKILESGIPTTIARIIVGYIFLTYGIGKIANPTLFVSEIANYDIVPNFSLNIIALILPWLETICGVLLITGVKVRANSVITASMMFVFVLAVVAAMARGLDINCGCSSTNPQKVGLPKLIENLVLLGLSIFNIYFPKSWLSLDKFD